MKINISFNGETKSINFTKPQAEIVKRLLLGNKATFINTHRISGGEFVWYDKEGYEFGANSVGIKAFNGALRAISKAFGLSNVQQNALYDYFIV